MHVHQKILFLKEHVYNIVDNIVYNIYISKIYNSIILLFIKVKMKEIL